MSDNSSIIKSSSFASTCAIRALNNATVKYRLFVEDGMSVEQEMTEESDPCHSNFFYNNSVIEINIVSYLAGIVAKKIESSYMRDLCGCTNFNRFRLLPQ